VARRDVAVAAITIARRDVAVAAIRIANRSRLGRQSLPDATGLSGRKPSGPPQQNSGLLSHVPNGGRTLARVQGSTRRAAKLLGAVDTLVRGLADLPRAHFATAAFESDVTVAQAELGDADFVDAFEEGRSMTTELAIAYALGASSDKPPDASARVSPA
jgi:hypothetical protein